jgi:hypothetical protein
VNIGQLLLEPLQLGFMQRGLVAAVLVGIVCAVMGAFVCCAVSRSSATP